MYIYLDGELVVFLGNDLKATATLDQIREAVEKMDHSKPRLEMIYEDISTIPGIKEFTPHIDSDAKDMLVVFVYGLTLLDADADNNAKFEADKW